MVAGFFATGHACFTVGYLVSLWFVSACARRLDQQRASAEATLEQLAYDYGCACADHQAEVFGATRLLAELEKVVGLAPYGYFRVSNSSFLGMTATLFTYMVVLLQFRGSEKNSE